MTRPKTANYRDPVDPQLGDLMTIPEYLEAINDGLITDSDGMGNPVKDGLEVAPPVGDDGWPAWIYPSQGLDVIPEDATHIVWFNR
jgi:hypothetical protein